MPDWAKPLTPNSADQKFNYMVNWYIGRAKRRGWATTLTMLENEIEVEAMKAEIKKRWKK